MSVRLTLVAVALLVVIGVAWCQETGAAQDIGTLTQVDYEQEDEQQFRDKRQAEFYSVCISGANPPSFAYSDHSDRQKPEL